MEDNRRKLRSDEVDDIVRYYIAGITVRELSDVYHVTCASIYHHLKKRKVSRPHIEVVQNAIASVRGTLNRLDKIPILIERRRLAAARQRERDRKNKVRAVTRLAVETGKIPRGPCEVCGVLEDDEGNPVEVHHLDYNNPHKIMWLCKRHHQEWHNEHEAIQLAPATTDLPAPEIAADRDEMAEIIREIDNEGMKPEEVQRICDAIGGTKAMAERLEVSDRMVRYWCQDGVRRRSTARMVRGLDEE